MNRIENKKLLGVTLILFSTLFFTISTACLKSASDEIDSLHLMFWRSVIGLSIVLGVGLKNKRLLPALKELNKNSWKWLITRGLAGGFTMFSYFTAVTYADLGEVGALHKLSPVFSVIFGYFILREKLDLKVWMAVTLAIIGVFFIRNPFVSSFGIAHVLVLMAAMGSGFVLICVRKLKLSGVDTWLIISALLITALTISFPRMILDFRIYQPQTYLFVLGAGVASTIGQLLTTTASKYIEAKSVSILGLFSVFEIMLAGIIIFGEGISVFKITGAILIVSSAAIVILFNLNKSKTVINQVYQVKKKEGKVM
jgi:drug/metabolite transporter (DMT)-like permease